MTTRLAYVLTVGAVGLVAFVFLYIAARSIARAKPPLDTREQARLEAERWERAKLATYLSRARGWWPATGGRRRSR